MPADSQRNLLQRATADFHVLSTILNDMAADLSAVESMMAAAVETYRESGRLITFGNGGSAAEAAHIAGELVGAFRNRDRLGLAAMCLSIDASSISSIANDYGYESIYARQLEAFGKPGDLALGLSTSGSSPNVVAGLERAKELGMKTALLTGDSYDSDGSEIDYVVKVPSTDVPRVQEVHLLIGHLIAEAIELEVFG